MEIFYTIQIHANMVIISHKWLFIVKLIKLNKIEKSFPATP